MPTEPESIFSRSWEVPWHAHIVPIALALVLVANWLFLPERSIQAMTLSWQALEQGRAVALIGHMFAHGGFIHVLLNTTALLAVSAPLVTALGRPPLSWARYLYIFLGSGFTGAAAFLIFDQTGGTAMLGASGAIFGLFGAFARVHPRTGTIVPVRSTRTWLLAKSFLKDHALLIGGLAVASYFGAHIARIAWQAHVGGLLFGVFSASLFLRHNEEDAEA